MANKSNRPAAAAALYAFDAGNGSCKGISSETHAVIQFAPVIAPISDKRAVDKGDEKPTYSLKVDDQVYVFGVDDVFEHGKRTSIRRLNSISRYDSADYMRLIDVLFLQCFAVYRGNSDYLAPAGAISLPISQYNNPATVQGVQDAMVGKRTLIDYEGCTLRLEIRPNRLTIVPESYGSLMHWAYDPSSLKRRPGADLTGSTVVIDIGYETTDTSLFEAAKYQRDQAFTIERAGMGVVARSIQEYVAKSIKGADVSRVDRAMQTLGGLPPGAVKRIEPLPGVFVDVTEVYEQAIDDLGQKIAQQVETHYAETPTRYLLSGGGAYHLEHVIRDTLGGDVKMSPDADTANAIGAFTALRLKAGG